ncbi:MAG: caspase family protein [Phaeodactylibacter sp.]|nr:caspase family protein [Phaeodactylibacter sp.]MCB9291734.1 caspase family protein [Lewinellaceae bacterium]
MADKGIDLGDAGSASAAGAGANYLLAIAIDEYQHCPRLYNCVNDARRLIGVLSTQYQFEKENTFTLFNEQATEHAIISMFKRLVRLVGPQDNLLVLFSGHGEYEQEIDEGYWIPVDAPLGHTNEYVANSRIVKYIKAINSRHTFLIVDSCFSGSLFASRSLGAAGDANRLYDIPSRWLLTAGRNEVVSDGQPGAHSPFADNVIYFLENNPDPGLPVTTLISQVVNAVIHNARQTPRGEPLQDAGHRGGQFHFFRKGAAPVPGTVRTAAPELAAAIPPRPGYRKYGWIAVAAIALAAAWLLLRNTAPAAAGKTEAGEQLERVGENGAPQARYDSLLAAAAKSFQTAAGREQYEEALALFTRVLGWAEENGLDTGPAEEGIRQCRARLAPPEAEKNSAPEEDYASLLAKGQSLFQNGRFAAAARALEEALRLDPQGKEARSLLKKCREELDWQRAEETSTDAGYRAYLRAYPDGRHAQTAQQKIAALYRYELYFTTSLNQDNLLTINIGKGKAPFEITVTYLATGEQIRKTAPDTQPLQVSLSRFNSTEGKQMVEIVVRDDNFKAKGQKMPLLK